jgi:hypothetical protein
VWGAWHFPLFWEADSFSAPLPFAILRARLFAWLPPFRVVLIYLHERTRSLPLVMLMHAAVSFRLHRVYSTGAYRCTASDHPSGGSGHDVASGRYSNTSSSGRRGVRGSGALLE